MEFKFRNLAVLWLLLLPLAQFCWRNRHMPKLGRFHDDGMLFVSAKSLAQGSADPTLSVVYRAQTGTVYRVAP